MRQLTFKEWLQINPVAYSDNDDPCLFCGGDGYIEEGIRKIGCEPCNRTGKQVVADAYGAYLNRLMDDWKKWKAWKEKKNVAKSPQ